MAIQTRFGNAVTVIGCDGDWVKVRRNEDGKEYEVRTSDLRADNGIQEINAAIAAVGKESRR